MPKVESCGADAMRDATSFPARSRLGRQTRGFDSIVKSCSTENATRWGECVDVSVSGPHHPPSNKAVLILRLKVFVSASPIRLASRDCLGNSLF